MTQISVPLREKPAETIRRVARAGRLYFVDNLRTGLVIMVVLHHIALVYGASLPGYYYVEPPFAEPMAFSALLIFALFNQAWFMGAFFLLAGYFTPRSYDRKGFGHFLGARFLRLGIPLLFFYFVLSPIAFIGYFLMPAELTGITAPLSWQSFWATYPEIIGMGPLWFAALLLIFSLGYAGWRGMYEDDEVEMAQTGRSPGYLALILFILALALLSYLMRVIVPLGQSVWQFPTLAYLPQYLSFYVLGIIAYRRDWFRSLSGTMGAVGFVLAIAAAVVLFPLAFSGQWFSLELTEALDNAMGAGHWQSAVYALWDSTFAVGLTLASLTLFRSLFNGQGRLGRFLAAHGYTVYIIHIPIVVFLTYALRDVALGSLPKTVLAAAIIVPVCYAVAYVVRKLPLADRVL